MAVPKERVSAQTERPNNISPLRPGLTTPDQVTNPPQQEAGPLGPLEALLLESIQLSPEAINRLYITQRPAAIDRRNQLLRMGYLK